MRSSLAPAAMRAAAALLGGADPQFGQAHCFGSPVVDVVELGVGRTVPSIEDLVDRGEHGRIRSVRAFSAATRRSASSSIACGDKR